MGRLGEGIALRYLRKKKYVILETGYRLLRGEIDIIARDGRTLVFIEVKTRTRDGYGRPEESVTPAKQQQIRKVAQGYLIKHRLGDIDCRFDVIALIADRDGDGDEFILEHFHNAF